MNKSILCSLLFIGLLINLQSVMAYEPTGVSNNVTITILDNRDALFSSIKSLEIQDKTIIGHFWGTGEPVHKNIIPESIVLTSNKGNLNYSLSSDFIDIFVNGKNITFRKDDPLRINLQYKIKEFLKYDNQKQLYYISQLFHQYNRSVLPKYYHLNVTIIFPFDLYPTSGPNYIPFLCYPTEELTSNENFSITLLQVTPPILQFNKSSYREDENLFILAFFDLLRAPPKMTIEINEELDLDNARYNTITTVTNRYPYELCYTLNNDKNGHIIVAIQNCTNTGEKKRIYRLKPGETSPDYNYPGNADKKPCNNSIIESFYPFECFTIGKNVPIESVFYPEKLQKDFKVEYILDMKSSKGFVPDNKTFDLRLLPEIMCGPTIKGFGCQVFYQFHDKPTIDMKSDEWYTSKLETKVHVPTSRSNLSYSIMIERNIYDKFGPLLYAIFIPLLAYFVRKRGWIGNKKHYYLASFPLMFGSLIGFCVTIFHASLGEVVQLKSVPLILMIVIMLIIMFKEFKLK